MIQNAKKLPTVYYGLHFAPGLAEYAEPGKDAYRILINESAAKKMDPTFQGKPIYVDHVEEVDLENLQQEADGYVLDSFYNKADGKHWVRFIVVSDVGHDAIGRGWKLSNAYVPKAMGPGGNWHGMDFDKEILDGEYEHLAIVKDPRYSESIILTPQEFKQYNDNKEIELKRLANSKEEIPKMKLSIFRKTKVENSKEIDFDGLMVELPLSKTEMSLSSVVAGYDKVINMAGYASDEHMVKLNDSEEMSVKDLRDCHNKMMEEKKKNEEVTEPVAGEELGEDADAKLYPNADEKPADEDDDKKEKKENEIVVEAKPAAKKNSENFKKLKDAPKKFENEEAYPVVFDGIKRGKQLFGSN